MLVKGTSAKLHPRPSGADRRFRSKQAAATKKKTIDPTHTSSNLSSKHGQITIPPVLDHTWPRSTGKQSHPRRRQAAPSAHQQRCCGVRRARAGSIFVHGAVAPRHGNSHRCLSPPTCLSLSPGTKKNDEFSSAASTSCRSRWCLAVPPTNWPDHAHTTITHAHARQAAGRRHVSFAHEENGRVIHTGQGCTITATRRSMRWLTETRS